MRRFTFLILGSLLIFSSACWAGSNQLNIPVSGTAGGAWVYPQGISTFGTVSTVTADQDYLSRINVTSGSTVTKIQFWVESDTGTGAMKISLHTSDLTETAVVANGCTISAPIGTGWKSCDISYAITPSVDLWVVTDFSHSGQQERVAATTTCTSCFGTGSEGYAAQPVATYPMNLGDNAVHGTRIWVE
jgi:hypothetical protein